MLQNPKRYVLVASENEQNMIEKLMNEKAFRSYAEIFRAALSILYDKKFPPSLQSRKQVDELQKLKDSMTNEQYCEYLGGNVREDNKLKICFFPNPFNPESGSYIDLNLIKTKKKEDFQ